MHHRHALACKDIYICTSAQVNKTIKAINLSGNAIGANGAGYLADALSQPGVVLEALILSGNDLEDEGGWV